MLQFKRSVSSPSHKPLNALLQAYRDKPYRSGANGPTRQAIHQYTILRGASDEAIFKEQGIFNWKRTCKNTFAQYGAFCSVSQAKNIKFQNLPQDISIFIGRIRNQISKSDLEHRYNISSSCAWFCLSCSDNGLV